ncbi:MerR family transcriptional regulator, partial [Aeromonas salmonicida]
MYIGEFARLAGTTPKAIRLYEQMGLLPEPRRHGKYRVYRAEDLEWVGFIRQAQQLGCKLSELTPLLAGMAGMTDMAQFPWQKVERGVVAQISQQIMISPAPSDRYTRGFLTGRP